MAFLTLSHGYTRAIPKSICCFSSLVVIMAAGAERCTEFILVLGESLNDQELLRE
jgi:hypothetical protein